MELDKRFKVLPYCCFGTDKKVLKKSEQFNVIHTTMGLLKILESLNDGILKTEKNDND